MKFSLPVMQLVLGQFLVCSLVLLALPHLGVLSLGNPETSETLSTLPLTIAGAMAIVMGFVVRSIMLKSLSKMRSGVMASNSAGMPASAVGGEASGAGKIFAPTLVSFALFEGAAMIGFVIAYTTGQTDTQLVLGVAAVGSMLLCWPTNALAHKYSDRQ